MLIDDVTISIKAGDGGNGGVAFNKNMMSLGPAGGNGGDGGDIYMEGVSDLGALNQFRYRKEIAAGNGERGRPQFVDGPDGEDIVLRIPIGTIVYNLTTGVNTELVHIGEQVLVAKGGRGGKGNLKFRSPHNTSPRQYQKGLPGEEFPLRLELKLIADVGFVGFPNAGKSSLLNELTRAKSKVANYKFTTLEPHLGAYYDLILADIPGLIEGASEGKGLGIKFLQHIERTNILFHFISAESETSLEDYRVIREELGKYNKELLDKKEYVFLTKTDLLSPEETKKRLKTLSKLNPNVLGISVYDDTSLKQVTDVLNLLNLEKTSS
jgi:GTPase